MEEVKVFTKFGKIIGKSHFTVQHVVNQDNYTGFYKVRPCSGRSKQLTVQQSNIVRKIKLIFKITAPRNQGIIVKNC